MASLNPPAASVLTHGLLPQEERTERSSSSTGHGRLQHYPDPHARVGGNTIEHTSGWVKEKVGFFQMCFFNMHGYHFGYTAYLILDVDLKFHIYFGYTANMNHPTIAYIYRVATMTGTCASFIYP